MTVASDRLVSRIGRLMLITALLIALPVSVVSSKGLAPAFILAVLGALLSLDLSGVRNLIASHRSRLAVGGALLAFVGYGMLSAFWSVDPARSLKVALTLGAVLLGGVALLAAIRHSNARARYLLRQACLIGFGITLALLAFEYATGATLNRIARFGAVNRDLPLADMNFIKPAASLLGVFLFPIAAIALSSGRRLLAAAAVLGSLAAIVFVSVSSAAIAAGAGLFAALLYMLFRRWALRLAAFSVCMIAILMPVIPNLMPPLQTHYTYDNPFPNSAMHRFRTWQFTAERIAEKPVLGWGLDSSRHVPGGNTEVEVFVTEPDGSNIQFVEQLMPLHPHNWFLQIWLELGAVGMAMLAAVLVLLLQWIGSVGRSRAQTALLFGQAVAIIGTASLSFGAWQNWWLGAVFLSFAFAATVEHDDGGRETV